MSWWVYPLAPSFLLGREPPVLTSVLINVKPSYESSQEKGQIKDLFVGQRKFLEYNEPTEGNTGNELEDSLGFMWVSTGACV